LRADGLGGDEANFSGATAEGEDGFAQASRNGWIAAAVIFSITPGE